MWQWQLRRVACSTLPSFALALVLTGMGSGAFYDEGARFSVHVANFAAAFRRSGKTEAVFEYVPKYGVDQRIRIVIDRLVWCPHPPCYNQGAATVWVQRGKSGTGYRIAHEASVPRRLTVEKAEQPVRVHLRKVNGVVEIVALD